MTNQEQAPTGTLQDLIPHLKPALGVARHPRYGEVDIIKHFKNGKTGIRYLSRRQFRVFTASVHPHELTEVAYR